MAEVLTRDIGMAKMVTPTGRQLGVVKSDRYPGLMEIKYTDGVGGELPKKLTGSWTKRDWAESAIKEYLNEFWDTSDKATKK